MSKRKTTEEFIREANEVHGCKYDYSKTLYINCKEKVVVVCPEHGEFMVTPDNHIRGRGCPICRYIRLKVVVNGFTNDLVNTKATEKSYITWKSMLVMCYYEKSRQKYKTYKDVTVCEEWHKFSNFKKWFDKHYVDGWQLDKDILVKGNKVYSPSTCCFVPSEINAIVLKTQRCRGIYPIGVSFIKKLNKFRADYSSKDTKVYLGLFDNHLDAFKSYKEAKEKHIKEVILKYKDKLEPRVYEALYNYKVEITD